jgi:hypothetical protein
MTQFRARHTVRRFRVITARFDDFCLFAGFRIRVAYGQPSLLASLPRNQQASVRYFAPDHAANGVLKVRGDVIYEIGIANKSLTVGARAQLRFMLRLAPP